MSVISQFTSNTKFKEALISFKYFMLPFLINSSDRHITRLQEQLKKFFPDHSSFLFDSGRTSLYEILRAYIQIQPDLDEKEIILAGHTCLVVVNSVLKAGLNPVYIDFTPDSYRLDPNSIESQITDKTKFILLQHTFGFPEDVESIQQLAKKYNLIIIEDLAHSFLGKYSNQYLGTFSDSAFLSFGSNKILSCLRGGAAITKNQKLSRQLQENLEQLEQYPVGKTYKHHLKYFTFFIAQKLYFFLKIGKIIMWLLSKLRLAPKVISISEKHSWTSQIESYQISDSLAHICLKQFQRIPANIKTRQSIANIYKQELQSTPEVKTFDISEGQVSLFYPILVADPARLQTVLKRFNVILNLDWTGSPISPNMKSFKKYEYDLSKTPVAQAQAKQLVLLPLHQNMTEKKAIKVTSLIKKYYESHR